MMEQCGTGNNNKISGLTNRKKQLGKSTIEGKGAVRLLSNYTTSEILDMAKSKSPNDRNELMHVITDLIDGELTGREKDLIGDILVNLVCQAVKDIREAVSSKLAHRGDVPEKLILHLAHDEIQIAQHVLMNSPLLSDEDLLYILKSKDSNYWGCIARRRELSAQVIDAIVDKRKKDTCRKLAHNNHIMLTDHAFNILGDLIMEERDLAEPVLTRQDVPVEFAERLYAHVGEAMQSYIAQKFGDHISGKAVKDVTDELVGVARGKFVPDDQMRQEAATKKRDGILTLKDTIDTLRRGQIPSFIAMFSEYMELSEKTIESILREQNGRSLAVLCRYHGLSRADFVAIFLMVHKLRSYEQIVPQNDLQKAMKYFDRIDNDIAKNLMAEIIKHDRN